MYSTKYFNYNYMEFFGYDTCEKSYGHQVRVVELKNKTIRKRNSKIHINKVSTSSKLGFHCPPISRLVIYRNNIWFYPEFKHIHKKVCIVLEDMNKLEGRYCYFSSIRFAKLV